MSALPSKADIDRPAFAAPRRASRSNKRTGDSPWGSEVALAITLGDFNSQIRQRNLGTKLRDQILLAVLTCPPTFFTREPHHVAGVFAKRE